MAEDNNELLKEEHATNDVIVQEVRASIIKAERSLAVDPDKTAKASSAFGEADIIDPPYLPRVLCRIFENSSLLLPNVSAYSTNIDSFGHRFEAKIDPDADDAHDQVADAMWIQDFIETGETPSKVPSNEAVESKLEQLRVELRIEKWRAEAFFASCCSDMSFVDLRVRTRNDIEITGNGYWEVVRSADGQPHQIVRLEPTSMRLTRRDSAVVEVDDVVRATPFSTTTKKFTRRFRRFVQSTNSASRVYFKEWGDPRVMSPVTGSYYTTVDEMRREEDAPQRESANEVLHFKIHWPGTPYGVPRWIGPLPSIMGNREAAEVNHSYFNAKTVPPMAILVSGGTVSGPTRESLESFIRNQIKGRQNFHKVLIIEGLPGGSGGASPPGQDGRVRIDIKPLTDAQQKDALFLNYDERNADKVGTQFRNPRLLRGDVRDFNRATAAAALKFAEQQVYGPQRNEFDWIINRKIMLALGVVLYDFQSLGPTIRDPEALADMLTKIAETDALTPADVRMLAGEMIFDRQFPVIDERWIHRPLEMTTKGMVPDPLEPEPSEGDVVIEEELEDGTVVKHRKPLAKVAAALRKTRDEIVKQERIAAQAAHTAIAPEPPEEVTTMSLAEFEQNFGPIKL